MADSVGTLKTNVIANAGGFVAGMRQAQQAAAGAVGKIKASFAALGTVAGKAGISMPGQLSGLMGGMMSPGMMGTGILGGAYTTMQGMASHAKELQMGAAKRGMGVEAYQELSRAAEKSGSSIDAISGGLNRMRRSVVDANSGNAKLSATFAELGIKSSDLMRMDAGQQLEAVAAGLAKIQNANVRFGLESQIFGKGASEMDPMLMKLGRGGLKQYHKWYDTDDTETMNVARTKNTFQKDVPGVATKIWADAMGGLQILGTYVGSLGQVSMQQAKKEMDIEAAIERAKNNPVVGPQTESDSLHALGGLAMAGSQAAYQASTAWQYGIEDKKVELLQQIAGNTSGGASAVA